jgi:hypothetical protein
MELIASESKKSRCKLGHSTEVSRSAANIVAHRVSSAGLICFGAPPQRGVLRVVALGSYRVRILSPLLNETAPGEFSGGRFHAVCGRRSVIPDGRYATKDVASGRDVADGRERQVGGD